METMNTAGTRIIYEDVDDRGIMERVIVETNCIDWNIKDYERAFRTILHHVGFAPEMIDELFQEEM